MGGYIAKLVLVFIGIVVIGFIGLVIFGNIWARSGIIGAMVVLVGVLLFLGWNTDRRDAARRAEYDEV